LTATVWILSRPLAGERHTEITNSLFGVISGRLQQLESRRRTSGTDINHPINRRRAFSRRLKAAAPARSSMDKATYDKGLEIRRAVLGEAYVDTQLKNADDFNRPLQELVTEYCWGAVWGREGLPRKTRSMLNLAMISILNRQHELKAHIRGALTNGVSKAEICEVFLQVAIYAGVPAAVDSFRTAREVFAEMAKT
jgi:4-carboxymuconolactone decarboxylase